MFKYFVIMVRESGSWRVVDSSWFVVRGEGLRESGEQGSRMGRAVNQGIRRMGDGPR